MPRALRRQASVLGIAFLLAALLCLVFVMDGSVRAASGVEFKNFELAATPPQPVGTTCPGSGGKCTNNAAEPAIRADKTGNFYASSENGLSRGTLAWKSTDNGRHYSTLVSPNSVSAGSENTGFAPGGGDTDLAVAAGKNASGRYNVYVSSLSLANVTVSTSKDGGQSFSKNVTSATVPGDDREWIAADGSKKVCISYHDIATENIDVNCSYDAGKTFTQFGTAIDQQHVYLIENNQIGNLTIDPESHDVYQVLNGVANAEEAASSTIGYHAVWMGVSTDGGKTFRDYPVYISPNEKTNFNHQFTNVSVDKAGNVYAFWSNDHNVYYSYSTDHGKHWSGVKKINSGLANTAIFPWSSAGDGSKVDVVYYGTSYYDGKRSPDSYPSSAKWHVYMAQIRNAASADQTIHQYRASPVNHLGGVCESGVSCSGNRDLYDDFGVAASPTTGLASIVYSDDQPGNNAQDDHTSIATQASGPGIFGGS
jgi:hypothetical protein